LSTISIHKIYNTAQPKIKNIGGKMDYLIAFLVGGGICLIGQLFINFTALTPARILTGLVVLGVILGTIGWYDRFAEFAGAGATVPLTGFGALLAKGVRAAVAERGVLGIFTGGLTAAGGGITAVVCFAILTALCFRRGDKVTDI
jgi:stage V sporulation protein AE